MYGRFQIRRFLTDNVYCIRSQQYDFYSSTGLNRLISKRHILTMFNSLCIKYNFGRITKYGVNGSEKLSNKPSVSRPSRVPRVLNHYIQWKTCFSFFVYITKYYVKNKHPYNMKWYFKKSWYKKYFWYLNTYGRNAYFIHNYVIHSMYYNLISHKIVACLL